MRGRPRIEIRLTVTNKIVELIGWMALLMIWILTITSYSNLPDIIPTHYNRAGHVDGFGNKVNIMILPILATLFFIGLTILNRFPHIFNYPTKINKDNAIRQYTNMTRMNRYLKLVFVIIFGLLDYKTIQSADGLSVWFLPLTTGSIFILIAYFIIKSYNTKQR